MAKVTVKPCDDWEVSDAFRTICRADEIRKDKVMMAKVRAYAQKNMQQSAKIVAEDEE